MFSTLGGRGAGDVKVISCLFRSIITACLSSGFSCFVPIPSFILFLSYKRSRDNVRFWDSSETGCALSSTYYPR